MMILEPEEWRNHHLLVAPHILAPVKMQTQCKYNWSTEPHIRIPKIYTVTMVC